jgi:hypothetical protein
VSDLQELEAVLEHMEMLQTMSGNVFSENNNIKSFSNWAWNYKISCKKSKRCTVPIPCLRETWLHLLTDCILDPPRKNDGLALQTPEFLKTHVRSEEKRKNRFCHRVRRKRKSPRRRIRLRGYRMFIPCPRETWLHMLNPQRIQ